MLRGAASVARRHAGGIGHEVRRYLVITPSGIGQKYADNDLVVLTVALYV